MLVLALSMGEVSADLRAGHGVPHTARTAAFLSWRPVVLCILISLVCRCMYLPL